MRRIPWYAFFMLLFAVRPSFAIQLRWSSGGPDLSFAVARRCTLMVESGAGGTLPPDWRLVWVAAGDSSMAPIVFRAEPSTGDPAAACEFVEPADPAAVAARTIGARFCAAGGGTATSSRLVLDAVGDARARFQVVAFVPSPTDSMEGTTLRSSEITLNGGCSGAYPPVVFRAASSHHLGQLEVRLSGTNLSGVSSVPICAPDSSWSYPLALTSKTDERISAQAVLAAPLPAIVVGAADGSGGLGAGLVAADSFPPLDPQSCFSNFAGAQDTTALLPKDFAFIDAGDSWHIFYTRQYGTSNYTDRTNTRRIGHAISTDQRLSSWIVIPDSPTDTTPHVRPGRVWDNLHVWAPSIVRKGITYYMFYTGVQLDTIQQGNPPTTSEIQRIGIATSVDLHKWKQDATPIYFNKKTSWAFRDSTHNVIPIGGGRFYSDAWQFRDPFVMPDPANSGNWVMYFVTIDSTLNHFVVGVATTQDTSLRTWQDKWPLRRTSATFMSADRDESPHALFRHGKWWLVYTSNHQDGDQITYSLNATSPVDSAAWSRPDSLKAITCGEHPFPSSLNQWHGSEYVGIGSKEFLAAWADNLSFGGVIQFTQVLPPDGTCPTDSIRLDCPDVWTSVDPRPDADLLRPVSLMLVGPCPARSGILMRLAVQVGQRVHVGVYDVFGRRVKTLLDGPAVTEATALSWNGRDEGGRLASSGVYFVRATCASGRSTLRAVLIR